MTTKPYIYAVIEKRLRYWTGTGWSMEKPAAKRFRTEADAENVLRPMMLDNIKAKVGKVD